MQNHNVCGAGRVLTVGAERAGVAGLAGAAWRRGGSAHAAASRARRAAQAGVGRGRGGGRDGWHRPLRAVLAGPARRAVAVVVALRSVARGAVAARRARAVVAIVLRTPPHTHVSLLTTNHENECNSY